MTTLTELCNQHKTDKGTRGYALNHGYSKTYDAWFAEFRNKPIRLLEIGACYKVPFASMRVWQDYFHKAQLLVCYDIQKWRSDQIPKGVDVFQGDQTSIEDWERFKTKWGDEKFSIIIDDGSHDSQAQMTSLVQAWPLLELNGLYVVEDVYDQTAWEPLSDLVQGRYPRSALLSKEDRAILHSSVRGGYASRTKRKMNRMVILRKHKHNYPLRNKA